MRQLSLIDPEAFQAEEWRAVDPQSKKPVFVIGPFQSPDTALQYVQTYQGVNLVASDGGLYVASAALTSNLSSLVDKLARCLSQTTGAGPLS